VKVIFSRFTLASLSGQLLPLVQCYREVFADEPWNEWKLCPQCGQKFGLNQISNDHCTCGTLLEDFWPEQQVIKDLHSELTSDALCYLASNSEQVIGFSWSYPVSSEKLETKLELMGFATSVQRFSGSEATAYLDEIGVSGPYRRRGIAKQLYRVQEAQLQQWGIKTLLARTKTNPPTVVFSWFQRIGYQVIDHYHDADGRVIMAKHI